MLPLMSYSLDLRERVVAFVRGGGGKAVAARRFSVSRKTVYNWLSRVPLAPKKHGRRKRKLDWEALRRDIASRPDALLRERAATFGVHLSSVAYACKQLKITHKKNATLH